MRQRSSDTFYGSLLPGHTVIEILIEKLAYFFLDCRFNPNNIGVKYSLIVWGGGYLHHKLIPGSFFAKYVH